MAETSVLDGNIIKAALLYARALTIEENAAERVAMVA